ncbi:hypothetical protein BKK56_03215 [Rodentibacter genomosp. 2]|nr:hypothetical protein BKK56_03215 [Rodentibacter genomosp. 2]
MPIILQSFLIVQSKPDLAVGQIKTGSMSSSDRIAKSNQLEEALGEEAPFNGLKEVKGQE